MEDLEKYIEELELAFSIVHWNVLEGRGVGLKENVRWKGWRMKRKYVWVMHQMDIYFTWWREYM